MYPALEAELARRALTRQRIADDFKIAISTVSSRLTGKTDMPFSFAVSLRKKYEIDIPLEVLFRRNDRHQHPA